MFASIDITAERLAEIVDEAIYEAHHAVHQISDGATREQHMVEEMAGDIVVALQEESPSTDEPSAWIVAYKALAVKFYAAEQELAAKEDEDEIAPSREPSLYEMNYGRRPGETFAQFDERRRLRLAAFDAENPHLVGQHCHATRDDGDCDWADCPQNRDGEPGKTGRHCPLDRHDDEEG